MPAYVKAVLTFVAAATAAAAAAGPANMPEWAQIALAALAAGFAAIGIIPPVRVMKTVAGRAQGAKIATVAPGATDQSPMLRGIKAQSMGEVYERGYEHGYQMGGEEAAAAARERNDLAYILADMRDVLARVRDVT